MELGCNIITAHTAKNCKILKYFTNPTETLDRPIKSGSIDVQVLCSGIIPIPLKEMKKIACQNLENGLIEQRHMFFWKKKTLIEAKIP